MELVILIGVATLIGAILVFLSQRDFKRKVDRIPGPPAWPLIGNTLDIWKLDFELLKIKQEMAIKYGPFSRLLVGPKVYVFLSDPADVEILLSSQKHIEKGADYGRLHPWIGLGLLTSTGKLWHGRRKLLTPAFHFKILEQFVEVFDRNSSIIAKTLQETKEDTTDVSAHVTLCTLDIICETAMGTAVNAQKHSESEYVQAVRRASVAFVNRVVRVWLRPDLVFNLSPDGRTFHRAVDTLHQVTEDVIAKRIQERAKKANNGVSNGKNHDDDVGLKRRSAFLDHMLDANESSGANLSQRDIRDEVDTFMFEGHDTTSAGVSWALYCLARHPDVQEKVAEEMEDLFGDSDRAVTHQDLLNMSYLERVIKETLRLYPSVPVFTRELKSDLQLTGGRMIPAGCSVSVNVYMMGRNPEFFPDPEKFDPDRFLPENCVGRHPYAYVPFSAGPRNCIGQKFAMLELKSTIAKIVRRCRLKLPSPDYKPPMKSVMILKPIDGLYLKIEPRGLKTAA